MRILWHSTAPWSPSSYSVLTARTVPPIVRSGHAVTLSTWFGLQGQPLPWSVADEKGELTHKVTVLPHSGGSPHNGESMRKSYMYFNADLLITCSDVWVFPPKYTNTCNFAPWLPVDYDPVPVQIAEALEPAIYPMVYSKFGVRVLEDAGIKSHYVPCSAPAKVFTPGDKQKAREYFAPKKDYDFLVTMVAANKDGADRKGFAEALQGFAKFLEKYPRSMLYLHTNWNGPVKIMNILHSLGIHEHAIQPDQYAYAMGMLDEKYMTNVYRASDVLLNPCKSEGFGLPLVEAQMCGCPIAATDFATTDEMLFAGWKLDGQMDWGIGPESWRLRVYVDSIVDALEQAYKERDNRKLQKKARNGAMRYDNETVFNQYWKPALKEIDKLISQAKFSINGREKEPVPEKSGWVLAHD